MDLLESLKKRYQMLKDSYSMLSMSKMFVGESTHLIFGTVSLHSYSILEEHLSK